MKCKKKGGLRNKEVTVTTTETKTSVDGQERAAIPTAYEIALENAKNQVEQCNRPLEELKRRYGTEFVDFTYIRSWRL